MSEREAGSRKPEAGSRKREAGSFDVAIDRAVREMLDIEQPAGLRGRVLRQIENPLSTRTQGTRHEVASTFRWKIFFPLAVAAVLILAVLAPWRTQTPAPIVSAPPQVAAVTPPVSTRPPAPQPKPPTSASIPPRPQSGSIPASPARVVTLAPDRRVVAAVYTPPEPVGDALEPLGTITPIQMTPIADQRYAPAEIAVRPLNPITDVQIAPLTPPERRN